MFISERGLNLIKEFEGCILQSYDDYNERVINQGDEVYGTLTIGWGHIENVYKGQTISQADADALLLNDMERYCSQVNECINDGTISFPLNQNMYDALVSFDYNCGQGSLRTLCGGRGVGQVADALLLYNRGNGQVLQGLVRRRQAERDLFLSECESGQVQNVSRETISGNDEIRRLQHELNVQGFTDENGNQLSEDGIGGQLTLSACPLVKRGAYGNITQWIQLRVGVNPDCDFGGQTEEGVKYFQRSRNIDDDGEVGKVTWSKFFESI